MLFDLLIEAVEDTGVKIICADRDVTVQFENFFSDDSRGFFGGLVTGQAERRVSILIKIQGRWILANVFVISPDKN